MRSGQKTVTVFITVILALVVAIVGYATHWPAWAWAVSVLVLAVVPATTLRLANRHGDAFPAQYLQEPDLPIPPVERRELLITGVGLPSTMEDYDFLLTATVRWCPLSAPTGAPLVNLGGLAVDAILERASRVSEARHPARSSYVQHELNGVLATMRDDSSGRVEAMALNVTLTLSERDQERLDTLAAVRKDEDVWEHERKYEQSRRAYLGDDVLKDTGSAIVWWLHRNEDSVDATVKDIGLLAQLTSAANDEDISERLRHLVPPVIHDPESYGKPESWIPAQPAEQGKGFGHAFAQLLQAAGMSPDDKEVPLLAAQVDLVLGYREGDPASEIRHYFAKPNPPEENGPAAPEATDPPGDGPAD